MQSQEAREMIGYKVEVAVKALGGVATAGAAVLAYRLLQKRRQPEQERSQSEIARFEQAAAVLNADRYMGYTRKEVNNFAAKLVVLAPVQKNDLVPYLVDESHGKKDAKRLVKCLSRDNPLVDTIMIPEPDGSEKQYLIPSQPLARIATRERGAGEYDLLLETIDTFGPAGTVSGNS
jgi:hypothetical protein